MRPYCNSLDFTKLAREDAQNILICHCVRRGSLLLVFFMNKHVVIFTEATSILYFKLLCWICFISVLSTFLGFINLILNPWLLLSHLLCHQLFNNRHTIFFCHARIFTNYEHLILPDGKLVGMIQHRQLPSYCQFFVTGVNAQELHAP